jgi:hypothetical protein
LLEELEDGGITVRLVNDSAIEVGGGDSVWLVAMTGSSDSDFIASEKQM